MGRSTLVRLPGLKGQNGDFERIGNLLVFNYPCIRVPLGSRESYSSKEILLYLQTDHPPCFPEQLAALLGVR